MAGKRRQHTAVFKVQVALAALRGDKTVNEWKRPRYVLEPDPLREKRCFRRRTAALPVRRQPIWTA
jgi:hypothetical protein